MVKQSIAINFMPGRVQPYLKASKGDTGERIFDVYCYTEEETYQIPAGSTVVINGNKPGNFFFVLPCTFSGNKVTFDCTATMTDVCGQVVCELVVMTPAGIVQSANFILYVERPVVETEEMPQSDYKALTDILEDAEDAARRAEEAAASLSINSKTADGLVEKGGTNANKVWKTDADGNPAWREDANDKYTQGTGITISESNKITANIANNATTTAAGYMADARQLNKNVAGSYAAGIETRLANVENFGKVVAFKNNIPAVDVPSGQWTKLAEVSVEKGIYLVCCYCVYSSNANGRRYLKLADTDDPSTLAFGQDAQNMAVTGDYTRLQSIRGWGSTNNPVTFRLYGWQNSGVTLQCIPSYIIFRTNQTL